MEEENAWIRVEKKSETLCITSPNRMQRIHDKELCPPKGVTQYPVVMLFIGGRYMHRTTSQLFRANLLQREKPFMTLDVDLPTRFHENPVYFARSDPFHTLKDKRQSRATLQNRDLVMPLKGLPQQKPTSVLYSRFFLHFTDIVVIDADDFSRYEDTMALVNDLVKLGASSSLPRSVRPRVLVLSRKHNFPTRLKPGLKMAVEDLQPLIGASTPAFTNVFQTAWLVKMPEGEWVNEGLLQILEVSKALAVSSRREEQVLFSSEHLAAFFERSLDSPSRKRFDFIAASRKYDEINPKLPSLLSDFAEKGVKHGVAVEDMITVIGSALAMNFYTPKMHIFEPLQVFETLYLSKCRTGLQTTFPEPSTLGYVLKRIQKEFKAATAYLGLPSPLSRYHADTVSMQTNFSQRAWKRTKSNRCCFFCLYAKPEHVLECGHSMCDDCVMRFGRPLGTTDQSFEVSFCMYCGTVMHPLMVHLKPPTAGVRILSVDGGGVRGIIPLQYLNLLQSILGPACPVQDFFDIAVGTSVGGLILLDLFVGRRTVNECTDSFQETARVIFKTERPRSTPKRLIRNLKGFLADGIHDSADLKASLEDRFGGEKKLFDHPASRMSSTKVAVTATTTDNTHPCIFSNYNGQVERPGLLGYTHCRPRRVEDECAIWQAAMATSAAPGFFKAIDIPPQGRFQDGSLAYNCPVVLTLRENEYIWSRKATTDVVLSLGTGNTEAEAAESPRAAPKTGSILKDGFPARLLRSLSGQLDGNRIWMGAYSASSPEERKNMHRFSPSLGHQQADIDDVRAIESLRKSVDRGSDEESRKEVAIKLLASSIYFQLLEAPILDESGLWKCNGMVLCRIEPAAVMPVLEYLFSPELRLTIKRGDSIPFHPAGQICGTCKRFSVLIKFEVRHLGEVFSIELRDDTGRRVNLSGFPQTMESIVNAQALGDAFRSGRVGRVHECCSAAIHVPRLKPKKRGRRSEKGPQATKKRAKTYEIPYYT